MSSNRYQVICAIIPSGSDDMEISVQARDLGEFDVIVAGGGLAGTFAAVSAAREGCKVLLVESCGCLGGMLTAGSVPCIMDEKGKGGMLQELFDFLDLYGMRVARFGKKVDEQGRKIPGRIVDSEGCKVFLDKLVRDNGVTTLLYSRVAACRMDGKRIRQVLVATECGNYCAGAKVFIDATGNGNLAALAGCDFEWGQPGTGHISPATTGFSLLGMPDDCDGTDSGLEKRAYGALLEEHGIHTSVGDVGFVRLPAMKTWDMNIDFQYGVLPDDIHSMTRATMESRQEVFEAIEKHKKIPGYESLWISHTAEHLGLREGRRVFGHYRITDEDIASGRKFEDGICLVRSKVDVHKLHENDTLSTSRGVTSQPFEIPFRSLIARDAENLLLAGRCISGDFYPHGAYRMMGNTSAMGEAAGFGAAYVCRKDIALHEIPADALRQRMREYL